MKGLKRCPFCGGVARIVFSGKRYGTYWEGFIIAKCQMCSASSKGIYYCGEPIDIPLEETQDGEDAIDCWNRRVSA